MSQVSLTYSGIQGTAAEIAGFVHQDLDLGTFYQHFLDSIPRMPGMVAAIAWSNEDGEVEPVASASFNPPEGVSRATTREELTATLSNVCRTGYSQVIRPASVHAGVPGVAEAPIMAFSPVIHDGKVRAIIETFLPASTAQHMQNMYLRDLEVLCQIAAHYHGDRTMSVQGSTSLTDMATAVHSTLKVEETAYAIANESRRVLKSDRVAVATIDGGKARLRSVSGQQSIHRRANSVKLLERLIERVAADDQPLQYPHTGRDLPPQLTEVLEQYLEASHCRGLLVMPMKAAPPPTEANAKDESQEAPESEIVGALVLEQFSRPWEGKPEDNPNIAAVVRHSAQALHNARAHESIFLYRVWEFLGRSRWFLKAKQLPKTIAAVIALGLFVLALCLIPARLKVSCPGKLQPEIRRYVFATSDATVQQIHVEHGASVRKDDPLVTLHSDDLELALEKVQGELSTAESDLSAVQSARLAQNVGSRMTPTEINARATEQQNLQRRVDSLRLQQEILLQQRAQLELVSPIDGQVISWNLADTLQLRPVQRGQRLVELADLDGPWIVELQVPDRRIAHVLDADQSRDGSQPEGLPVTFMLSSDPKSRHQGHVTEIAGAVQVVKDQGSTIKVTVAFDRDQIEFLQPGMEVQGRIHCREHRLGYVWLHQVWEFLQANVFFHLW